MQIGKLAGSGVSYVPPVMTVTPAILSGKISCQEVSVNGFTIGPDRVAKPFPGIPTRSNTLMMIRLAFTRIKGDLRNLQTLSGLLDHCRDRFELQTNRHRLHVVKDRSLEFLHQVGV